MTDYTTLITSQHINKPKFVAKVSTVTGGINAITQLIQSIPDAFDVDNAIGAQLDIVGLWVGRLRTVNSILTVAFFGFSDDGAALPFGEQTDPSKGGRFYEQGEPFSSSTVLGDPEYRTIIKAKIVRNQWNGTTGGIEAALQYVFNAPCTVVDNGTLNLTINVSAPITAVEKTLLTQFDLLPRPAGVRIGTINA